MGIGITCLRKMYALYLHVQRLQTPVQSFADIRDNDTDCTVTNSKMKAETSEGLACNVNIQHGKF